MADRDIVDVLLDKLTDAARENERQQIVDRLREADANGLPTPLGLATVLQIVRGETE